MARDRVRSLFTRLTEEFFAFLIDEDFIGPEYAGESVIFHAQSLAVEVALDSKSHEVLTIVRASGEPELVAELSCLYVESGLGAAQRVPRKVTSGHSLQKVLKSQSEALVELLPLITTSSDRELLKRCHRR